MGFLLPPAEVEHIRHHLDRMGLKTLRQYVGSERWARRRSAYYSNHPYRCTACGGTRALNLHHRTYARMGNERDEDLTPLCETPCHFDEHMRWAREVIAASRPRPRPVWKLVLSIAWKLIKREVGRLRKDRPVRSGQFG